MREAKIILFDQMTGDMESEGQRTNVVSVFGKISKASQREYFSARQNRFNPEFCVSVWEDEYSGQRYAEINNVKYEIYRTYDNEKTGKTEIYLTKKLGVV